MMGRVPLKLGMVDEACVNAVAPQERMATITTWRKVYADARSFLANFEGRWVAFFSSGVLGA